MKQNKKMTLLLSLSLPFSVSCKGSETYGHEKVLLSKSSMLTSTVLLETKQQLQDVTRYLSRRKAVSIARERKRF